MAVKMKNCVFEKETFCKKGMNPYLPQNFLQIFQKLPTVGKSLYTLDIRLVVFEVFAKQFWQEIWIHALLKQSQLYITFMHCAVRQGNI